MKIYSKIKDVEKHLETLRKDEKIGFIPTMGALHEGHLSLIKEAKREATKVVCSIFVNPTQFSNKKDLLNYPKTLEKDVKALKSSACDILFAPSVEEMYPGGNQEYLDFDIGPIENILEGEFRKDHFKGVVTIVYKLLQIIKPHQAYFGEKDFQQLMIIREMVRRLKIPVKIRACPTIREQDGLAMSSRNIYLSPEERKKAGLIAKTLFEAKTKKTYLSIKELKNWVINTLQDISSLKVEYFEIVNEDEFKPIKNWNETAAARACIAVKLGGTRLIDNVALY